MFFCVASGIEILPKQFPISNQKQDKINWKTIKISVQFLEWFWVDFCIENGTKLMPEPSQKQLRNWYPKNDENLSLPGALLGAIWLPEITRTSPGPAPDRPRMGFWTLFWCQRVPGRFLEGIRTFFRSSFGPGAPHFGVENLSKVHTRINQNCKVFWMRV